MNDKDADKVCRDIASQINDSLTGEQIGVCCIGAVIFSAITSARHAVMSKEQFLDIAAAYFDEGLAERRKILN